MISHNINYIISFNKPVLLVRKGVCLIPGAIVDTFHTNDFDSAPIIILYIRCININFAKCNYLILPYYP